MVAERGGKVGILMIYGGMGPSNRLVLQSNHGSCNWPRNYLYENRNARMGFVVLMELEYRMG